jgi:Uma2 family endonuclease
MTSVPSLDNAPQRAKLSARDFWTLADSGAFEGLAKVELIEGEIWAMNAIHSWHARVSVALGTELTLALRAAGSPLTAYGSGSIAMSDDSVPEPDLSIGETNDDGPLPLAKLRLAIELSDTSLKQDLDRKARLYGAHGVPEYWVVDRDGQRTVQMWEPGAEGYAKRRDVAFGERLESVTIAGMTVETGSLK